MGNENGAGRIARTPARRRTVPVPFSDRLVGALVGAAVGDMLGMPVEGLSHPNVRTYYKGIQAPRADEKRGDLGIGQWTADTQRARALTRALASAPADGPEAVRAAFAAELATSEPLRRPEVASGGSASAAACAAPLGVQARLRGLADLAVTRWVGLLLSGVDPHPVAHVAAAAHVAALREALAPVLPADPGPGLLAAAHHAAAAAERLLPAPPRVSDRLATLSRHLGAPPLDLHDASGGTASLADTAVPFAIAMVARGADLPEATLLSAVNVGGDASAVGTLVGALLGALHGTDAFPRAWLDVLEDADAIRAEARALADALVGT